MVSIFKRRRDLLCEGISQIPHLSCKLPEATFYLMVNISKTGMKSFDFAINLLKNAHVAVVPGITYGDCCDDYVRIAFTLNEDKITEGINRIKEYMKTLEVNK